MQLGAFILEALQEIPICGLLYSVTTEVPSGA